MQGSSRRMCAVALATMVLNACADGPGGSVDEAVVRDSAGVTIVESGPAAPRVLQLSAEPLLEIGQMEGAAEYQLHRVRFATRLSDGTTAVANTGSNEIRFYDVDGRHVSTSGGRGGGPGEFEFISYMTRLAGDTVLVYDSRSRRVTILDPDGAYVRDFTPEVENGNGLGAVDAASMDGSLLVTGGRSFPEGSTAYHRDTLKYRVLRGDSVLPLRTYGGMEASIRMESSGNTRMVMLMGVAFGRNTHVSAGADRFYIGSSDTYEVHAYDTRGTLREIIRSGHVPGREVTDELFEQYVESSLENRARLAEEQGQEFDAAAVRKTIEETPRASSVPLYADLLAVEDGGVWVKDFTLPGMRDQSDRWTIFAADGRIRGIIDLPPRFDPLHVVGDTVTGVIMDEYDVEYVHVYTISG